jgi:hypothetical protein
MEKIRKIVYVIYHSYTVKSFYDDIYVFLNRITFYAAIISLVTFKRKPVKPVETGDSVE